MKYEKGDKVVVEITEADEKDKELTYGVGNPTWIRSKYILGKLEDFTESKKIKMTVEEKKEFDRLNTELVFSTLDAAAHYGGAYPALNERLFKGTVEEGKAAQIEFVKALEHPELIEVVKDKKYYIKILGQYLDYDFNKNVLYLHEIEKLFFGQNIFTQSEIDKMQKLPKFQAIDLEKCKEEAENE